MQLSIGADIEAYGDQAGAASNRFSTSLRKKPAEWYNCQGPTKLLVSSTFLIFRLSAWRACDGMRWPISISILQDISLQIFICIDPFPSYPLSFSSVDFSPNLIIFLHSLLNYHRTATEMVHFFVYLEYIWNRKNV